MSTRYTISPHKQGTHEWLKERMGCVTGAEVAALYAKGKAKGAESETRTSYMRQLVLERLEVPNDGGAFLSRDMAWGIATEPLARLALVARTGYMVREAGFCRLKRYAAGCSVDSFIDGDEVDRKRLGISEIKCPKSKTHLAYLEAQCLPEIYVPQVTHNMWVTGAKFCKFISYDPRFPPAMRMLLVHVERDEAAMKTHEALVLQFLLETDSLERKLRLNAA